MTAAEQYKFQTPSMSRVQDEEGIYVLLGGVLPKKPKPLLEPLSVLETLTMEPQRKPAPKSDPKGQRGTARNSGVATSTKFATATGAKVTTIATSAHSKAGAPIEPN